MNKKFGCPKCEYTGFAYGKIPCECRENSALAPETENEVIPYEPYSKNIMVSGCVSIPQDYGIITYFGDDNKPRQKIEVGDWVTSSDLIVGVALTDTDESGMTQVMLRDGGIWLLQTRSLQKCPPNWNPGAFL